MRAERFQVREMLPESKGKATEIVTLYAVALSSRANDRPKCRVMRVRYARKEVMLDLMI